MFAAFGLLLVAITTEVMATAALPRTGGFRDPGWTALVVSGYAVSIWLLAVVVRQIPVSVTYALWSGIGTAAIAVIGVAFMGERMDVIKVAAVLLISVGVAVLNLHTAH